MCNLFASLPGTLGPRKDAQRQASASRVKAHLADGLQRQRPHRDNKRITTGERSAFQWHSGDAPRVHVRIAGTRAG